jgi:hypothetical protein
VNVKRDTGAKKVVPVFSRRKETRKFRKVKKQFEEREEGSLFLKI